MSREGICITENKGFFKAKKVVKAQQILPKVAVLKNEHCIQYYGCSVKSQEILNTCHLVDIWRKIDSRHQAYVFSNNKSNISI